jgi:ketosteroid isomerase-like protein
VLEPAADDFARDVRADDAARAEDFDLDDFEAAWRQLGERMLAAARKHDVDGLAECYTRNARLFPLSLPTMYGRDEIAEQAPTFWAVHIADIELKDLEFYEVGDKFCVFGTLVGLDRRGDVLGASRFLSLYKFEQGRWRIHREIVNN